MSHVVADAGGTKEVGYRIASLYRELARDPGHHPPPNLGSRSLRQVYRQFLPRRLPGILRRYARDTRFAYVPLRSTVFPSGRRAEGSWTFVFHGFGRERVERIRSHGARTGATLNDLVMTAHARAIARQTGWAGRRPLRLGGTVDFRRYIPGGRADAICNVSGLYFAPRFDKDLGADFDGTLAEVKRQMDAVKSDYPGLGLTLAIYLFTRPFPFAIKRWILSTFFDRMSRAENQMPFLTNMGPIDERALDFGRPAVASAVLAVPPIRPPSFACGLSGFRGTLALSAGFYESAIPRAEVQRLFDLVDEELPGGDGARGDGPPREG